MKPAFMIKENEITVFFDGIPKTVPSDNKDFQFLKEAIKNQDWDKVKNIVDKISLVKVFVSGDLKVENNIITFKGEEVHGYIVNKILQFIEEELDAEPLIKFLNKLMNNPSSNCINELYSFLEQGNMPIDPDGDFYAYKAVQSDFTDKHTGTILNKIGSVIKMPRWKVDDISANDCSHGLHAGSIQYVKDFASPRDKIIIVKINPANVVSVPTHDVRKLRCCEYTVVQEFEGVLPDTKYDYDNKDEEEICEWCGNHIDDCDCCNEEE